MRGIPTELVCHFVLTNVDEGTTNEREQPDPTCRGANRESLNQDDASKPGVVIV